MDLQQQNEEEFEVDIDRAELPDDISVGGNQLRPVDTNRRLMTLFWLEFELSRMTMGWVPCFPDWDIKGELMHMSYLHTLHMKAIKERIQELPGPGLNDRSRTPAVIRDGFEALSLATGLAEFAQGYALILTAVYSFYDKLRLDMDPILDAPSFHTLRIAEIDRIELLNWTKSYILHAKAEEQIDLDRLKRWEDYCKKMIAIMLTGAESKEVAWIAPPIDAACGPVPTVAATDKRFPLFDPDIHGEGNLLRHPSSPVNDSVKQMVFINASEMTSAESLAYLYYGVQGMPIDFYLDVARHTWDEARHSQMGVRRLRQWGYDTEQFLWAGTRSLTQDNLDSIFPEFYAGLTMIAEPCSFFKKRKSIDAFWKFGDVESAIQSEFDIADERLHVDFGQKWGAKLFEHMNDFQTAQSVQEKVRARRLQNIGIPDEEIGHLLKHFPEMCGFTTKELVYDKY